MSLVVSALYDIKSKESNEERRPVSDYTKYANYLMTIKKDMVIFTEESIQHILEPMFVERPNVRIELLPFEQFEYVDKADILRANALKNPFKTDSPQKTTVLYTLLMWNKFFMIQKAHEKFPHYDKYIWMDFGLGFVVEKNPCNVNEVIERFDSDHFSCTIINPMSRHEYDSLEESFGSWKYRQVGGFWSVGKNCIQFFMDFIRVQIEFILASERICADEEIMARFSFAHPDKCVFSFGDYASCVCNWIGLTHDLQVASNAINKSHNEGLHHMACQGACKVLDTYTRKLLTIDVQTVIHFMFMYYVQSYYIDKELAREIAKHFLLCTHVNSQFADFFCEKKEVLKQQFQFVMSEKEFIDWSVPCELSQCCPSYQVMKCLVRND